MVSSLFLVSSLLDMPPNDPRPYSSDNRPGVERAEAESTVHGWQVHSVLFGAVILYALATVLVRRRHRLGPELKVASYFLGVGGIVAIILAMTKPYFAKPPIKAGSTFYQFACTDSGIGPVPSQHGTYGGEVLDITVRTDITLTVINLMTSVCHFRVPELQIALDVPGGELRYTSFEVPEPLVTPIYISGGKVEQRHVLRARLLEDAVETSRQEEVQRDEARHPDAGRRVYESVCSECHALSSDPVKQRAGPSFVDLYGSTVDLSNGQKSVVDVAFVRWAIFTHQRPHDVRFEPTEHYFGGMLRENRVDQLIGFMRSQSSRTPALDGMPGGSQP